MELLEGIKTRRAIRKFKKQEVPKEVIERLLEDSRWAPVVAAFKGWDFVIVKGEMRDRLADLLTQNTVILRDLFAMMDPDSEKKALEYYRNLGDAPTLMFVTIPELPEEQRWEYSFQVLTATTEFMQVWLLAHREGLGACGITVPPYIGKQIQEELGLEGREIIYGMSLGYPDEQPEAKPHPRVNATYVGY
ncbi:MAG: nitroreductase family protein [Candidatus Aquicultor sp.]